MASDLAIFIHTPCHTSWNVGNSLGLFVALLLNPVAGIVTTSSNGTAQSFNGWGMKESIIKRDTAEYFALLRTDYKFRSQDPIYYEIEILIDPCRENMKTGGLGDGCCFDTNRAACQDYDKIVAGQDLQLGYFQNAHISTCMGTPFEDDPNCGSFIEIHRRGENTVLADVQLADEYINGFRTINIATHRLCVGNYELWWVVRTRSGPYVQKQKQFYVSRPSCPAPPQKEELGEEEEAFELIPIERRLQREL
eukprot:gnl/MRDRNA2_/MRDRNA2_40403_c0_seq1.p1 gnl/MRDRNA2_/MRDRNA2_40403_c0~~gnl/MRDRNA2_/MRDRNA2_40403_c0_seq1.p1  ORF type:complete len:251 (-),score=42.71 gnl/MRDRNA2_/MRDRNA2_40403_c0_seq1:114-866(-)